MEDLPLDRLRPVLARILGEVPAVAAAYGYGSRVLGRAHPLSDLDLALVLRRDARTDDPLLAERISARISTTLRTDVEVDVHFARDLPLPVRGRVVTSGVLLYEADPSSRVEFETATRRLYFDFLPLLERDAREALTSGG